jgi:hypothetical protein
MLAEVSLVRSDKETAFATRRKSAVLSLVDKVLASVVVVDEDQLGLGRLRCLFPMMNLPASG